MQFALLGDDPRLVPFLRAIVNRRPHRLTATVFAPNCAEAVREFARVADADSWEELLPEAAADAIIVAGDDPRVLEAARQLAAAGKAIGVWPSSGQTSTFLYQLTLIHAEKELALVPLLPLREHPQIRQLRERLAAGELGRIQHLRLDRSLSPALAGGLSEKQVADSFLCDVDLLRSLGGDYDQIAATRSGEPATGCHLATSTLTAGESPQAMWSLTSAPTERWTFVVAGERGKAIVTVLGDPLTSDISVELTAMEGGWGAKPHKRDPEADSRPVTDEWAEALLVHFLNVTGGGKSRPGWSDLSRDFELLEAFERSVERRRTIDVHFEVPSERGVFKSQMTAAGCGLLVFTFVAVVVYLGIGAAIPLPPVVNHVLRLLIFLPLGAFLILQLLIVLTRPPRKESGS